MPDMDMIIRGCESWIKNHKGEQLILEYTAVEDLLVLLKEQEPVKPKIDAFGHPYCPKCKILVYETWEFCPHCGRRMK